MMKPEQLEKAIPLVLISAFAVAIVLRVIGVVPPFLATEEIEVSRTIFIDAGIVGLLAVFAIVISLTLMSVQFASQEYTHRIMNTYVKSFMLWSVIATYISTILYNLYLTASLKTSNGVYADVSVLLQSLCLIFLIPHFIVSMVHLRPEAIVGRVLRTINKEYLLSIRDHLGNDKWHVPSKLDRLLPAVEMIEKSIERGDRATVRVALDAMHDCYRKYIDTDTESWAARYFLDYLLRIGREATIEGDDDSLTQILTILGNIGSSSSSANAARAVIENINTIGLDALKKDYDAAVEQMVDSFQQILKSNMTEEIYNQISDSYRELSEQLFSLGKKRQIRYLVASLSGLTDAMVEKRNPAMIKKWIVVLEEVGRSAVSHKLRDAVHGSIQAFYQVGTLTAKNGLNITDSVINSLLQVEREIDKDDRELLGEIEFAKKEIEMNAQKYMKKGSEEIGIETSDLW